MPLKYPTPLTDLRSMNDPKFEIQVTVVYDKNEYVIKTYINQYHSLMELISARFGPVNFGLCSGMGSCGTCLVEISRKGGFIEKTTLSCDLRIDDDLANSVIHVIGSSY